MEKTEQELFVEAIQLIGDTMRKHMGDTTNSIVLFDDGSGNIQFCNAQFEKISTSSFYDAEELYKEITDGK
jgi:hypothetical protein